MRVGGFGCRVSHMNLVVCYGAWGGRGCGAVYDDVVCVCVCLCQV